LEADDTVFFTAKVALVDPNEHLALKACSV